jgi:hypothetical protein
VKQSAITFTLGRLLSLDVRLIAHVRMSIIKNVPFGEKLCERFPLASSGADTCIVVLTFISDNDLVFMAHLDSVLLRIDPLLPLVSAKRIIEIALQMFCESNGGAIAESVFLYGGLSNVVYHAIDTSIMAIRLMNNDTFPEDPMVNVDKFRQFIAATRFHDVSFNLTGSSDANGNDDESNWISDITIVCDRNTVPITLALHQYARQEMEMTGDRSGIEPIVYYLIDILTGRIHVFFSRQPTRQHCHGNSTSTH